MTARIRRSVYGTRFPRHDTEELSVSSRGGLFDEVARGRPGPAGVVEFPCAERLGRRPLTPSVRAGNEGDELGLVIALGHCAVRPCRQRTVAADWASRSSPSSPTTSHGSRAHPVAAASAASSTVATSAMRASCASVACSSIVRWSACRAAVTVAATALSRTGCFASSVRRRASVT